MSLYSHLITYNGDCDFVGVYDKGQAEAMIVDLLKEGNTDIEVYKVEHLNYDIKSATIEIED